MNGVVTSHYETDVHHYGVDLAAAPKESVLATLDGTVIYTGFDPNHGNVIQLQHKNGFISVYKHNELLLKEEGDHVVAGDRFGREYGRVVYRAAPAFRVVV